jgi:hypothetical protein
MDYIQRYNKINEELKRKLSSGKLKYHRDDEERERIEKRPADLFSEEEIRMLKHDDFEVDSNEKEAKCVEKYFTFTIKKIVDVDDVITYILTAKDNLNQETYERRIKVTKREQHKETLDFMIDKCAYILHNMKEKAMKDLDPYGEESWEEDERERSIARKVGIVDVVGTTKPKEKPKQTEPFKVKISDFGARRDLPQISKEEMLRALKLDKEEENEDEDKDDIECPICHGAGTLEIETEDPCDECDGEGELNDGSECEECGGSGVVMSTYDDPCDECGGEGVIPNETQLKKKKSPYGDNKKKRNPDPSKYDECEYCNGRGYTLTSQHHVNDLLLPVPCKHCQGLGVVEKPKKKISPYVDTDKSYDDNWWDFKKASDYGDYSGGKWEPVGKKVTSPFRQGQRVKYNLPGSKYNGKIGQFDGVRKTDGKWMIVFHGGDYEDEKTLRLYVEPGTLSASDEKLSKNVKSSKSKEQEISTFLASKTKSKPKSNIENDFYKQFDDVVKPKSKAKIKHYKQIECPSCKGWGRKSTGGECDDCSGEGKIMVDEDYKGPTWNIGGASDISYGT